MKQREKWSGNREQRQESLRDIREKSKTKQNESTDLLREKRRILQVRQKHWQRRTN